MEDARRWHRRYRGELPDLQEAYLTAVFALADRAARRKRWVMAGTMAFLSLLSVAAVMALLSIRAAEQKATDRAAAAVRAEAQVREQLDRVRTEQTRRAEAETEATSARQARDLTYEELQRKNVALEGALNSTEESRRRARRAQKAAEDSAMEARLARDELGREKDRVEQLYQKERRRREELENQTGTSIIKDVPLVSRTADVESIGP